MKRQSDLTKKDLSKYAVRAFKSAVQRYGKDTVGGEWYVRLHTESNSILLIVPIEVKRTENTWEPIEYITVVA